MKTIILTSIAVLLTFNIYFSQTTTTETDTVFHYDYFILSGSFGAGGVVSTNIINSGAVIPASLDFMLQSKRHRFGIGITHELYLTPENLGKLIIGESSNVEKFYFIYEWTVLKTSPINIGFSGQFGGFTVGDEAEYEENDKSRLFGNIGFIAELGAPRFYLFVRPAIEYKSYDIGSWHKELLATVSLGLRWKIMSEEEKARRAAKKK
ncbi:MAG: hypothetical protein ABIJ97_07365 [Bacteroidota bacterium]